MSRVCEICGKRTQRGNKVERRGLAKRKGGVGRKITGCSKRTYKPNIQRVRALVNGGTARMRVCTACIRSGTVVKAG